MTAPATHQPQGVGHADGGGDIVGDDDDGDSLARARHLGDQRARLALRDRIESGERLVHQQVRVAAQQLLEDRDAMALAAGELGGPGIGFVAETEAIEHRARLRRRIVAVEPRAPRGHDEIAEHAPMREQRIALEHDADLAGFGGRTIDEHASTRRRIESSDHAKQRRLADARRTEEADDLTLIGDVGADDVLDVDGDVAQHERVAAHGIDMIDRDQRVFQRVGEHGQLLSATSAAYGHNTRRSQPSA